MTSSFGSRSFVYAGHKIVLPVILVDSPARSVVRMVLDTGAAVTTLNTLFLELLGISDVRSGQHIVMSVANDDEQDAWIHPCGSSSWDES